MSEESFLPSIIRPKAKVPRTISLGKYGSFLANDLVGRPYYYTYEILDETDKNAQSGLRIVPASELYADIKDEESSISEPDDERSVSQNDGEQYEIMDQCGEVLARTNRNIIDDVRSQTMTMDEIEALKAEGRGSGKNLIDRILKSHSALDQKTAFALAKYTLRKTRKYYRRFTALPLDVSLLARWMLLEKDPTRIMEMSTEILALICSWSNMHFTPSNQQSYFPGSTSQTKSGRWLVVDETGGLIVAAAAERMGVLYPTSESESRGHAGDLLPSGEEHQLEADEECAGQSLSNKTIPSPSRDRPNLAQCNTITLIHANTQPNLSLLRYFNFDSANPEPSHPLAHCLKTISWLQLLSPEEDNACIEPEIVSQETLQNWKSGKRGNYHRKRRRWEKIKSVVDETQAGGFDGLIIASYMAPVTILCHLVPLLRGSAPVVIYSPSIEPLAKTVDYFSSTRRSVFLTEPPDPKLMPTDDFPVDPSLLLAPTIHTVRCRPWQILPGRTHPLMTGRGGAEGYIMTATRVLPAEGKIEAKGKFQRRKKGTRESEAIESTGQGPLP